VFNIYKLFFLEFGVNFFSFGSFSDIYRFTISEKIGLLIGFVLALSVCLVLLLISLNKDAPDGIDRRKSTSKIKFIKVDREKIAKGILLFISLTGIFIFFQCFEIARHGAQHLKAGLVERYDLRTSNETLSCRIVIGSTSEYIFTFDYARKTFESTPKSQINRIELAISPPPIAIIKGRGMSNSDFQKAKHEFVAQKNAWINEVQSRCNQKIIWSTN